jgi:GntR family transcriptional regulator
MARTTQILAPPFGFRLDLRSGVPVYRQLIDQVLGAIAAGTLRPGDRLPTVRQVAVDLAINPNTVVRAYKELEIRGVLTTQQGTGTFISDDQPEPNQLERQRRLDQMVSELVARAGAEGYTLDELIAVMKDLQAEKPRSKSAR